MISFGDFQKVEMKVGKVLSAEKVEGTDKLVKIEIDIGETRTMVAGIMPDYSPEDIVGKQIVVVTNLEPRTIKGTESNAMLLAAVEEGDKVTLIVPDKEVKPGTAIE